MALSIGITTAASVANSANVDHVTTTSQATAASGSAFDITCLIFNNTFTFSSLADNKGNTYTQSGTEVLYAGGAARMRKYRATNATGGSGHTWTLTANATGASLTILVTEITGSAVSFDAGSVVNDTASPFTNSVTTAAAANSMLVATVADDGSSGLTEGNGFTAQTGASQTNTSFITGQTATKSVSATGSYTTSWTGGGATNCGVGIAAYYEGGGGGSTVHPYMMLGMGN